MVWVGKDLKTQLIPPPAMGRGTLHYPRVLQPGLGHYRDGTATVSLGSLCQDLIAFTVKKFFLTSNLTLPSALSLKSLLLVLSPSTHIKSPSVPLFKPP